MDTASRVVRHVCCIQRNLITPSIYRTSRRAFATPATSTSATQQEDLEDNPSLVQSIQQNADVSNFDPLGSSRSRKHKLPPSRYQYRSPKYDRGPLSPHQAPASSDPASREFVPGPFSSPPLEEQYNNTIAPDFMTMCYQHTPPGFRALEKAPRLRSWEGDSPYFANRQLRGPRGGDVLRLLRKPITFRNIPKLERVTVHTYVQSVVRIGSAPLHAAGMAIQAITHQRVKVHPSKRGEAGWSLQAGKNIAVTANLRGEDMYHFLSKIIHVVLPRIKDYRGIRATTGDGSGNLSFGLEPEAVGTFPEIEVNYDSYPPKMIPGLHVTIHTSATTDKDARLLLEAIGLPFYGKMKKH